MRAIAQDRAADGEAGLRFVEGEHAVRDHVRGVELVIAQESEAGGAELIRAGLRHRGDDGAAGAAIFRVEPVGQHLELRDDLLAVALIRAAAALAADILAIHLILRHVVAGRARLDVVGRASVCHAAPGPGRRGRAQLRPFSGRFSTCFWIDASGQLRSLRFDERRFRPSP